MSDLTASELLTAYDKFMSGAPISRADEATALRKSTSDLDESREYALALEAELKARAEQTSAFVAMASSMHDDGELEYDHRAGE